MCWKARSAASAVLLLAAALAPSQTVTGLGKWFDQMVANRISISGQRRLSYHTRSVTGDTDAYDRAEYGGRGLSRFTDFGHVTVNGSKVLGVLDFDLNIQDSRFTDPQANRVTASYAKGPWDVRAGDIRGSLAADNRFARFEKALTGAQIDYKTSRFQIQALRSESRSQPRTVSVQGNNSAGPYYLQSSQILRGSETILVDNVQLVFGQDYTMDYDLGSVTFVNATTGRARIIPPTSTIVATYEVLGFNGANGRVEGAHATYNLGKIGKVGVSALRQVQGTAARDSRYTETFLGFIRGGSQITLRFEPAETLTVVAQIGSRKLSQAAGEFSFPYSNRSIFRLGDGVFVPDQVALTIEYTPRAVNTVQGDREVLGLTYAIGLGKQGRITYSQALGRLKNTATPTSGTARGIDLRYTSGKAVYNASVREVPVGYVSIETTGFARNEKAQDFGVRVTPSEHYSYGLDSRNSEAFSVDPLGVVSTSRFNSVQAYLNVQPAHGGVPLTVNQAHVSNSTRNGKNIVDTTMLGTSFKKGRAHWRFDLSNQFASGNTLVNNEQKSRRFNLQTLGVGMDYTASRAWSFNMNNSLSRVNIASKTSIGRDLLFGFLFRPDEKFNVRGQFGDSDAGQLSQLGFSTGDGFGYGGNGFSSGSDSSTFGSDGNARTGNLTATYQPNDRLDLNANLNYFKGSGGLSSNSETTGFGFGANYNGGRGLSLVGLIDNSRTRYLESGAESTSTTLSLFADGSPPGNFSYRGGVNVLLSGGNTLFNQNSVAYELGLNYRLGKRHALSFSMDNGNLTGYLPQETRTIGLSYQYQIWRSLAFNIGYRLIDVTNRTAGQTEGAYKSRGLDIGLEFNFGR